MNLNRRALETFEVLMGDGNITTSFLFNHNDPMKLRKQLTDIGLKVTSVRKYDANIHNKKDR